MIETDRRHRPEHGEHEHEDEHSPAASLERIISSPLSF
jgi:hypothetical protein|tara:strand:- start:2118 stop:2231 length:114 start_codon:yes stop_codon:yes gene_type:complete